jgi:hypothetical protein
MSLCVTECCAKAQTYAANKQASGYFAAIEIRLEYQAARDKTCGCADEHAVANTVSLYLKSPSSI